MKLSAHRFRRNRTLLLSALLLALIAGFTAGAQPEFVGCSTQDLTPVPDTAAFSPAATAFAEAGSGSATEEPLPEKWVCLTFDDGPSKTTPDVLAALNTAGVHGTFFVVATDYNEKYLPLLTEAAAAGHQIALHSASHEYSDIYQSSDAYWEDIALLKERIAPYVDVESIRYLRFPGGSTNTVSHRYGGSEIMKTLKRQAAEKGYRYLDWNVCAEDAVGGHPSAREIYENVIGEAKGQSTCVVLMHDTKATKTTAQALPDIIDWFRENGYEFCTVSQMPLENSQ